MIEVTVKYWSATRSVDVVSALRKDGYVQGKDFDFSYHVPTQEYLGEALNPKYTKFIFYKEELASWFQLKYQ